MKTRIVTTMLAVLLSSAAFGQAGISIGLKAGLNFANLNTTSPLATYESRTGYHLGAFIAFKLTKIAIQGEVLMSQQGSTVKTPVGNVAQDFSYINIPILLKLYLVGGFNLQAGPQFGILSSAKLGGVDVKSLYTSSDISAALGAGVDLPFGLTVDARYNLGISEVNSAAAIASTKNQVFMLSVGYKLFKLGGK